MHIQIEMAPLLEMVGDAFPQWRPTGAELATNERRGCSRTKKRFFFFSSSNSLNFSDIISGGQRNIPLDILLAVRKELLACGPRQDGLFRNVLFRR